MKGTWEKPVIVFYKEREKPRETKALVAVKARKIVVFKQTDNIKLKGTIEEFFPLIGDFDYLFTPEGKTDKYVLCWFDDEEDDFSTAFRRVTGVTFPHGIRCESNDKGKKFCNTTFSANRGKLE
ncbi:MAG: hypothetical protein IAX21_10170 [Candidatus Bathyarchaeota archaeon]|nr:MAG: hypothetical protein IAX21_10170 [Candidatus Bathyarchaeota archaeon]